MEAKDPIEPIEPEEKEAYHLTGDRLGKFVILGELGRGSMGVVYEALQEGLGRKVALKVLPANITLDDKHVERFHREAEAVGRLNHPNIIRIYDNGHIEQPLAENIHTTHYFAMEIIAGTDFGSLRCLTKADARRIAALIRDAARALAHAHAEGVIHRDIKPSNLLVDEKNRIVVTDFGLARIKDSASLTSTDAIVGTPKYMAPEQILMGSKAVDGRADIYSLGATLYEALTGRPPLEAPSVQAYFKAILEQRPASPRKFNKECPHDLATIVLRCLEKSPKNRYPDADALADDLDRFLKGDRILSKPKGTVAKLAGWVHRHKVITGLAAVAMLALLLTLVLSGEVKKKTKELAQLQRINHLRRAKEVSLALIEAQELAARFPNEPRFAELVRYLHGARANRELDSKEPSWLQVIADLERSGGADGLWYPMALIEIDRFDKARHVADALPPASLVRRLTYATLDLEAEQFAAVVDRLTGWKENRPVYVDLIEARAHHGLAKKNSDGATRELMKARELLVRAREGARRRWVRIFIQLEFALVRSALGERVSIRDAVDDFAVAANRWWGAVAGVWEGMTKEDVNAFRSYVRGVLGLAKLPELFVPEIAKHAEDYKQRARARDRIIGHLLVGAAELSQRNLEEAEKALDAAETEIDEGDDADLDLLPYVSWGRSLKSFADGDMRRAVLLAISALSGAVETSGFPDSDLEKLANHTALLAAGAQRAQDRLDAKQALENTVGQIDPPPSWFTSLIARIASRASSSDDLR